MINDRFARLPAPPGDPAAEGAPVFLLADCGSTTTKVVLVARREGRFRLAGREEAPTTVEAPAADVTCGLFAAAGALAEVAGHPLVDHRRQALLPRTRPGKGIDHLLATSSAGGGLQMLVLGVVRSLTAASAEKAALGAGAIVAELLAFNDGLSPVERIGRLREVQPDLILLSGGVDGGGTDQVVQLAEQIAAAEPRPRFGDRTPLPVIFAGNRDARPAVTEILGAKTDLATVANLRPTLEREELAPAKAKIHELFMTHVLSRAPGYRKLAALVEGPVLPTPAACGEAVRLLAAEREGVVLAVDLGGATTDVFTVRQGQLFRSVSANLGLSYSLGNVFGEAGWPGVTRWLPWRFDEAELRNRVLNKMIRPTTVPESVEDLWLEQAAGREAMSLALAHHRQLAGEDGGEGRSRNVAEAFRPDEDTWAARLTAEVELIVGAGGALAHAPRPEMAALLLIDALGPEGWTDLAVDASGLLPQLGRLAAFAPAAALDVLVHDGPLRLGTCVSPLGSVPRRCRTLARCEFQAGEARREVQFALDQLLRLELPPGREAELTIHPSRGVDFGAGPGRALSRRVAGGEVGLILDGRPRPVDPGAGRGGRPSGRLLSWYDAHDLLAEVRA